MYNILFKAIVCATLFSNCFAISYASSDSEKSSNEIVLTYLLFDLAFVVIAIILYQGLKYLICKKRPLWG